MNTPPIIDMHTHIWGDASGLRVRPSDVTDLIEMADRFSLEAVVVIPLFGGVYPSPEEIAAGNLAASEFAKRDARFKPMVTVYPRHGEFAMSQLCKWMDEDFCALKIWVSFADEPCVFPLIEKMIDYGKPALIHAMHKSVGQLPLESDPKNIANLAVRYPEAKIIMPHIGGNFYYSCEVIAPYKNIFTDPSGTYCETGMVEHAVKMLGADRILFGSDAPGADFVNNLAKVMCADISKEDQRKILAGNAKKLWGWP